MKKELREVPAMAVLLRLDLENHVMNLFLLVL